MPLEIVHFRRVDGANTSGFADPAVPGLAIALSGPGPSSWAIYHIGSGALVRNVYYVARADAVLALRALASVADWRRPFEQLARVPGLTRRVKHAMLYPEV